MEGRSTTARGTTIRGVGAVLAAACALLPGLALADAASDAAAIEARLTGWAQAFNARNADGVCELFAGDLISVVPGAPEAGKATVCGRLAVLLAREDARFTYEVDIDEVLVWGDNAAVRLNWTLTVSGGDETGTSVERGIDLFRRDPDGAWRIMRFIAFTDDG
jgi:uncharacterized protein (TIGR02246 family)